MKPILIVFALSLLASTAHAQTPIVVGPNTQLQWDVDAPTAAIAQGFTFVVTTNANPPQVITLTAVTCAASATPGTQTCAVPATQIPLGSLSITMTSASGGVTSLPSTPFAYVDFVIPIPKGLRFK